MIQELRLSHNWLVVNEFYPVIFIYRFYKALQVCLALRILPLDK